MPLKLVELQPSQVEQFQSRHMDDYHLSNRLQSHQYGYYANPWLKSDSIYLQLQTNTGQPTIKVIDCYGNLIIGPQLMIQRQQNPYETDTYIYESATSLNALQEGQMYWFKITTGSITLMSEPIQAFAEYPMSLLIQYSHRKYYEGVIWETGFTTNIRVPGFLRMKPPAAKDTLYEDQILDMTMIKSVPYRLWEFYLGAPVRIPDYKLDIVNRVLGCSNCIMDGRYYSKNEGFKWEEADNEQNNLFKGLKGELRELMNRPYKIVDGTNTNEQVIIASVVDPKGFGDTSNSASSNLIEFLDIE